MSLCWKILPIHNTIGYQRMEDPQYCPNLATLECNLYSLAICGEIVEGVVDLKVKSISAHNCFSSTEFSASQGGVSIQQVSPTNNGTVKTVMTTAMSASATASTQGSQQVVTSGDEIVLEDFAHPVNAWVTCHISRLLCEFWYHSEECNARRYKTPIHQVYRPRGKKRMILERCSCPFHPLVQNGMK